MEDSTRTVVYEEVIRGQHHIISLKEINDIKTHYEYYVGVPKEHKLYQKDSSEDRWFKEPSILDIKSKMIIRTLEHNRQIFLNKLNKMKPPFESKYINTNNIGSLEHAWLSFVGNKYSFLRENYCYYGGGMSVRSFGEIDCINSSKLAMKLIGSKLLEIHDVAYKKPEPLKTQLKFEGN